MYEPPPRRVYIIWYVFSSTTIEENIFGFRRRGTWDEVAECGERITCAFRDAGVNNTAFDGWDEWRPRPHKRLNEDVDEKTAQRTGVDEGEDKKAGKTPDDDFKAAGEKLSWSYGHIEEGDDEEAIESWQDSINYIVRTADSAGRRTLWKAEDTIYHNVMTQSALYYFDNEFMSANIRRAGRASGDERFVFGINVSDDELKSTVSETLRDFKDEIDRWHVGTPREIEVAEAVEDVEVPATGGEHRFNWTTN